MQGSTLCGGHSNPAIPAAKVGNSHLPVNMEPRDPASVLAKHSLHSSPWALVEGSQHLEDPLHCGSAAQGTPGWAGSSPMSGGEVLAGQMTAGLSLCLAARVKLDSWEAVNPDQCCCCSGKNAYFQTEQKGKALSPHLLQISCHLGPSCVLRPWKHHFTVSQYLCT